MQRHTLVPCGIGRVRARRSVRGAAAEQVDPPQHKDGTTYGLRAFRSVGGLSS